LALLKLTTFTNQILFIMKKCCLILLIGLASLKGYSQTAPAAPSEKDWSVSLYGFVRTDYIYDSRKSATVRENNLNLYPLDVALDANGKDANAVPQSNFLSLTSRFGIKVKGPDVWGAKMNGNIEGDFFGNTDGTIGTLRLRNAFVNMDWSKTSLTMGQTWYPTFIPEVFPGVANFNTGIMFNPFGWASQVKLKQAITKEVVVIATAYKEREFTALGTIGTQNAASINSTLPSLNAQIQYKGKNWFLGAGLEYKSMQPLTVSATNIVTTEKVNSSSVFGYAKYSNDKIIIKAYGISGGNLYNLVMLGGFTGATNSGIQSYDPTKTTSFWIDIASSGKAIAPGFFFGNTKNNGSITAAGSAAQVYGRGITGTRVIDNVWRASGRVDFKSNKFRVTPELEYTTATWGNVDLYAKATTNKNDVGNLRAMVSCAYTF
jgi:hypothetical protein